MIDCEAEEPSWRPSEEFVVYPAVFWPHKNHVTVLDAIRCLSDAGVELHVVFPGGDAEGQAGTKEYVKRLAAGMGLSAKVHFPGFIPDSELRWAYENALALVYASLFGPDNLPPLEACLLGCPAIVAAIDGASDQLCDAAIFFEPLSGKDLATKIMALKKDSELRRNQIDRGKTLAIGLSVDRYIERLLTMFDELEMSFRCWSLDDVHRDLACREK
jgi:glycosyltransferase involved in cell wall biosynthesis